MFDKGTQKPWKFCWLAGATCGELPRASLLYLNGGPMCRVWVCVLICASEEEHFCCALFIMRCALICVSFIWSEEGHLCGTLPSPFNALQSSHQRPNAFLSSMRILYTGESLSWVTLPEGVLTLEIFMRFDDVTAPHKLLTSKLKFQISYFQTMVWSLVHFVNH